MQLFDDWVALHGNRLGLRPEVGAPLAEMRSPTASRVLYRVFERLQELAARWSRGG